MSSKYVSKAVNRAAKDVLQKWATRAYYVSIPAWGVYFAADSAREVESFSRPIRPVIDKALDFVAPFTFGCIVGAFAPVFGPAYVASKGVLAVLKSPAFKAPKE